MAANLHRKKNIFELLAPLWAVVLMTGNAVGMLYFYFINDSFESLDTYESWLRYVIWGVIVVTSTVSFVPGDAVDVVKHTVFYLISGGIGVGALWWYSHSIFTEDDAAMKVLLAWYKSGGQDIDYVSTYMRYAILSTLGLCAAVAAFCAIKTHMSASGWIKKHVK